MSHDLRAAAIARALEGPARASQAVRRAAFENDLAGTPEPARALLDKVVRHAYRVTDEDVTAAKALVAEDELFELVVCAAYGATSRQLAHALAILDEVG